MKMPFFETLEECVTYLSTYPKSKTEQIELEFKDDEIAFIRRCACELGCSVELFIWAVITMHYQEMTYALSGA